MAVTGYLPPVTATVSAVPLAGDESLEDVLARAAAGDRAAFGAFYDRTCATAFGLARILDPTRPEDLLGASYARAWDRLGRRDARPLTWLLAIVHELARGSTCPSGQPWARSG